MEIISLEDKYKVNEEIDLNDKVLLKMKYGVIRVVGENYTREITWETYNYLKNLPPNFTGTVEIKELKLTVSVNQIVKMEEKESETVRYKDFTKLPTESIVLDEDFKPISGTIRQVEREHDLYYRATCHYVIRDGVKQYCLEPNQIQYLVTMVREQDPACPHRISQAFRYGRDIHEIQAEQSGKRK